MFTTKADDRPLIALTMSVTLGLPVVRPAAEHGTAFDIAGRWIADPGGHLEAMRVAAKLAPVVRRVRV